MGLRSDVNSVFGMDVYNLILFEIFLEKKQIEC